jgi:hypothetical protein
METTFLLLTINIPFGRDVTLLCKFSKCIQFNVEYKLIRIQQGLEYSSVVEQLPSLHKPKRGKKKNWTNPPYIFYMGHLGAEADFEFLTQTS